MRILGFLLSILLFSSIGFADDLSPEVPVEFIDGKEAVIKDFCRTEDPGLYNDCSFNQHTTMVVIYVPESFGKILLSHFDAAKKAGYYDELSHKDFFHGHLLSTGSRSFSTAGDFFSDITALLYHSAEYNYRWEKEAKAGIPASERRQRSFVGYLDGSIQNAAELVTLPPGYEKSGTIYNTDIAKAHPELAGLTSSGNITEAESVKICKNGDCRVCKPFNQLNIVKESSGRFTTASGEKVELFLRCFPLK